MMAACRFCRQIVSTGPAGPADVTISAEARADQEFLALAVQMTGHLMGRHAQQMGVLAVRLAHFQAVLFGFCYDSTAADFLSARGRFKQGLAEFLALDEPVSVEAVVPAPAGNASLN